MRRWGLKRNFREFRRYFTLRRAFIALVGVWLLLLSGIPMLWLRGSDSAPGVWQAVTLHQLVQRKQAELEVADRILTELATERERWENDRAFLELEARRMLGWVKPGEILLE